MTRRPGEDELIATYFAPLAGAPGLGLRDDAALLSPPAGQNIVLTKDLLVAGVHFFKEDPAAAVARKSLRVNLSDLAAKGAEPLGYLLGLALPEDWTPDWLADFAAGLRQDGAAFDCPLLGGDTVKTSGPLVVSVTAVGAAPAGKFVPRAGARVGDLIYATGSIGDAVLGLKLRLGAEADRHWSEALSEGAKAWLAERYLLPQPRLALRQALRQYAHAAMDVSDGFAGDLAKMLRLTEASAEISIGQAPLSTAAREALQLEPRLIEAILTGGDDYELLCAIPPEQAAAFESAAAAAQVEISRVGVTSAGPRPPEFKDPAGNVLRFNEPSFQHF